MREFLSELRESEISVKLVDGDLAIKFPKGKSISPRMLEEIRLMKPELLEYLSALEKSGYADIPAAPQQESYPLSSSQRRLWILGQLEESSQAYHIGGAYQFSGNLDVALLETSLHTLIIRHEVLRTVFRQDDADEVRQYVLLPEQLRFTLLRNDMQGVQDEVARLLQADLTQPFDLATGPLLRARIIKTAEKEYVFSFVMHHIITDGWSMELLIKELLSLYSGRALPGLRIQYKDYAVWQQQQLSGHNLRRHKAYWMEKFQGQLPVLDLGVANARPAIKTYNGSTLTKEIDAGIVEKIKLLNRSHDITMFMSLLAAVNALLHYYSGQVDIITGSPIAGRAHADLENQVGFYLNTLALRIQVNAGKSFNDLLTDTKRVVLGAYEHQAFPFDDLVDNLSLQRNLSRNALFDVMMVFLDEDISGQKADKFELNGLSIKPVDAGENNFSKFDLSFNFAGAGGKLTLRLEYNTDIYSRSAAEYLAEHLEQLLRAVTARPATALNALDWISKEEREKVVRTFNNTNIAYRDDVTVTAVFEEQVRKTPANTAVVFGSQSLNYAELNEQANQLARYLRYKYNIKADDLVAIKLPRSLSMIVAILAVHKAGGAYVPIDPSYPQERIDYIINDSNCAAVIDENELEAFRSEQHAYDTRDLPLISGPSNLAYVIYTSGTTGQPKGVMIEHRSLLNVLTAVIGMLNFKEHNSILSGTTYTFDISVFEFLAPLVTGGRLIVALREDVVDVWKLQLLLAETGATHMQATPSAWQMLVDSGWRNAENIDVFTAGEAMPEQLKEKLISFTGKPVLNLYGPTEAAIYATGVQIHKEEKVTIGKPMPNTQTYILNSAGHAVGIGVVGELCLSGVQLARGYINKPELTAEKFVDNPFGTGKKMYRTGDLARWLPDGNIAFIGRSDDQVKIRGHRIELGEIEKALRDNAEISAAAVLVRKNELAAYMVSAKELNAVNVIAYLKTKLPDYMVPLRYVQVPHMPLTPNGKVDRRALPDPEGFEIAAGTQYVAPVTGAEIQIAAVWREVLRREQVSIKDSFFVSGGDSIKSIQLVSKLKQRGYSITIRDIMMHPVLEELALKVKAVTRVADQSLVKGEVPLSPVQHRFFTIYPVNNHHYNQCILLQWNRPVVADELEKALHKLILHHDALRMVFHHTPAGWVQENKGSDYTRAFEIITVKNEEELTSECNRIQSSIDLTHGPLFKAVLIRGLEKEQLFLVAHHLVIDGISWRIIMEDLEALYAQKAVKLPSKTDSFKYWQEQQIACADSEALRKEISYWKEIDNVPHGVLPGDGNNLVADSSAESILFDEQFTDALVNKCYHAYRTDINDILLAGLAMAFREAFGMENVLINLEGHGREPIGMDADVSRTTGWFTTMYPIVLSTKYKDPLRQLIETKEYLHRIPNKGIGYGILQSFGGITFNNKPQITFNYLGEFGNKNENNQSLFEFSGYNTGRAISAGMQRESVLEISGLMANGKINLAITYSNQQFSAATIQQLAGAYRESLETLVAMLAAEQTQQLTPVDLTYKGLSIEQLAELNTDNNLEDIYPLSPLQEGFFYHWSVSPGSSFYFDQVHYRIRGKLEMEAVGKSYQLLVQRHAVLRTCFTRKYAQRALQVVKKQLESEFIYTEVRDASGNWLEQYKQADINRGFDLYSGSQMRLTVLKPAEDVYEFIWSHHHILMDGWCTGILISEFFEIYNSATEGRSPLLGKVHEYSTYIGWLEQQDEPAAVAYWKNYLSGYDAIASIPGKDVQAPHKGTERSFRLSEELTQAIKVLCAQKGITENTFIQTIWGILLGKYNNTNDVVFGIVVSGRPGEVQGIENMIGLFINSVPLRVTSQPGMSAGELLKQVQKSSAESASYHYTQLADIQAETPLGKDLFNHLVQFQNFPVQEMVQQSVDPANSIEFDSFFAENDFGFTVIVSPGREYDFRLMYNGSLYDETQVRRIETHFTQLTKQVIANADIAVAELDCIDDTERQELLTAFNATQQDYPSDKTIIELFEEQVRSAPATNALVAGSKTFTYQQLNEQANQLAHYLRKNHSIQPNDIVAIRLEKREQMIVSILATLKAGGAYLPIDPEYPGNRIEYMVSDSNCKLLIDEEELSAFNTQRSRYSKEDPVPVNSSSNLAYVIYTSGSTGKPKGVMVEHRSLVNLSWWQKNALNISTADRVILYLGVAFDAAVMEFFPSIISGACLYTIPKDIRPDAVRLAKFCGDNAITICALPAQMAEQFMEAANTSLRYLIAGGDKLTDCPEQNYTVINQYGPTENTVVSTCYFIEKGQQCKLPPIGKPVANVQTYILDQQMQLVPAGVAGELFVGGDSLARGYINNEALTAEKFVMWQGRRLYRTGDVCRRLQDGNIEFVGRRDEQVKIRGFRIEPGEIENALLGYNDITAAVVLARTDAQNEKQLVAYIVGKVQLNAAEIKSFLQDLLPDYMLPAHYMQLNALPLNANGKVDRNALPDPHGLDDARRKYVPPRTATERKLVEIWEEVLGRKGVGVQHDFFESGGHSLRATRLSSQIHKKLNAEIPLADIFAHPVLEDQAALIENINKSTYSSIEHVPDQDGYELSASQRRLWILTQFDKANIAYNIPGFYEFKGELDKDALQRAFNTLIDRHEILRTVFRDLKQYVLNKTDFTIGYEEGPLDEILRKEATAPFDLSTGPMMRAKLIRTGGNTHVFSFVMHHIISDGWSMQVIVRELMALYNACSTFKPIELPQLRIQYRDFAAWQLQQLQENLQQHKEYWLHQMFGEIPVLEFPTDNARPAVKTFNGFTIQKTFSKDICSGLRRMSQLQNGTLFMGLLATVNALLYKYTGQDDIIIGTPVAGREHADLEDQVGFYINTLALRTRFRPGDSFLTLLSHVKNVALGAFEHQVYPFDDLVDHLSLRRDMSRNPLFDVFLVLQNTELTYPLTSTPAQSTLSISKHPGNNDGISKFDLTFDFTEAGEELVLNLQYNSDLFTRPSMERLLAHMEQLLNTILTSPQLSISEMECLSVKEKAELEKFNFRKGHYSLDKTIADLFEAQVQKTPDSIAVCFENVALTYASLNAQANKLAAYLRSNYQISPDRLVAIKLERSEWMIISVLAVLKAGGAYVPIDPSYPQERIDYMLQDSNCKLVIDEKELQKFKIAGNFSEADPERSTNANNLVYVIYTSGSTGRPKGVMVENRGLANTVLGQIELFKIKDTDHGLQFASFSFDAFAWETFIMLLAGASITIVGNEERRNPMAFVDFVKQNAINVMTLSPVYLRQLDLSSLTGLKVLVSAGEAAQYDLFASLSTKSVAYNAYGPTEASICGTIFNLTGETTSASDNIPIGAAIANVRVYVLDKNGNLSPVNVPGEICIAGPGVARGYLNRPDLTNEKFMMRNGERLYKTGDLGRWLPGGNLEYVGRKDEQVKLRGHRIELGEIESALRSHAQIKEAAVIVKSSELVAYVASDLTAAELRAWLAAQLPAYMMPAHFIHLERLPMTVNGKLDKKALPDAASISARNAAQIAPTNELEEKLLAVWEQLLNRKDIGVTDNFFEAGGNSIKIIQLSKLISQELSTTVSVGVLFQYTSIRDFVEYFNQETSRHDESIGHEELMSELDKFNLDENE